MDYSHDDLSRLERIVYGTFCFIGGIVALVCLYFSSTTPQSERMRWVLIGFSAFAVYGVFGLALKHQRRVIFMKFLR